MYRDLQQMLRREVKRAYKRQHDFPAWLKQLVIEKVDKAEYCRHLAAMDGPKKMSEVARQRSISEINEAIKIVRAFANHPNTTFEEHMERPAPWRTGAKSFVNDVRQRLGLKYVS